MESSWGVATKSGIGTSAAWTASIPASDCKTAANIRYRKADFIDHSLVERQLLREPTSSQFRLGKQGLLSEPYL
ncbi:hypothetical protein AJ88_11595 [Mesorhizobium amorphae CCBAU 01583]|nr:hypothetical protein AJ88_11595 [Mesorhizobium amorphae CCBAU 01583]